MLLLLLLLSSGCDVNIPGCGKRTLPFFKKPAPSQPSPSSAPVSTSPVTNAAASPVPTSDPASVPVTTAKPQAKPAHAAPENPVEMSITKAKPTATTTATPTSTPQEVEKIAYTTLEKGKPTLWTMSTDGTDRTRMTPLGSSSWYPVWSPNGKMLAFLSDMKEGKINLFVVAKGTVEFKQLTAYTDYRLEALSSLKSPLTWSPKSDEISYVYKNQVWKVSLDTLNTETLSNQDPNFSISGVEWAPHRDNKFVAFLVRKGKDHFSLRLSNPRLMDELKLAETSEPINDMSWSPDARDVAYILNNASIYAASPERSISRLLYNSPGPALGGLISYSPSEGGSTLMLLARKTANASCSVAILEKQAKDESDAGSLRFLTESGVDDAIWSPDGSKIAYTQSGELWVMDALNGGHKVRLAASGIIQPCWSKK